MATAKNKIRTLDNLIDYGNSSNLSEAKCITYRKVGNVVFADDLVYDKYRDIIDKYKITRELSTEEQKNYLYHPDRFCNDMYGNTNLYHIILYMNKCSEAEFAKNNIVTCIDVNAVDDVLPLIIANETKTINRSKEKL